MLVLPCPVPHSLCTPGLSESLGQYHGFFLSVLCSLVDHVASFTHIMYSMNTRRIWLGTCDVLNPLDLHVLM